MKIQKRLENGKSWTNLSSAVVHNVGSTVENHASCSKVPHGFNMNWLVGERHGGSCADTEQNRKRKGQAIMLL